MAICHEAVFEWSMGIDDKNLQYHQWHHNEINEDIFERRKGISPFYMRVRVHRKNQLPIKKIQKPIIKAIESGTVFHISQDKMIIGRSDPYLGYNPALNFEMIDPGNSISRRHAMIFKYHKNFYIVCSKNAKMVPMLMV